MKGITALMLLCCAATVQAAPFPEGDPQAGKKLFDQYNCNGCHKDKVGGDGSAIFTRPERKVTSPQKMLEQMTMCSGALGKKLSRQEQQHLGAYLNQSYYKFK
jgi:mono/diheme cytochrome c family protein